jgi:hypothetical protein
MKRPSWEKPVPAGATEVPGRAIGNLAAEGGYGFRHFTVEVEGRELNWPGSQWDPARRVWWGYLEDDRVVTWEGDPPPDNVS